MDLISLPKFKPNIVSARYLIEKWKQFGANMAEMKDKIK